MMTLTSAGESLVEDMARRHGLGTESVRAMLDAVQRGQGGMAQFSIAELGGSGQWMRGGMTMVGDMFNHGLKAKVDALCSDLAQALMAGGIYASASADGDARWWPQDLGTPSATGCQNGGAYAVFPGERKLAIRSAGGVAVYHTADHVIGGVSQQQGGGSSLTFASQHGSFAVDSLARADGAPTGGSTYHTQGVASIPQPLVSDPVFDATKAAAIEDAGARTSAGGSPGTGDILALIEKLGALRDAGLLTAEEFQAKKTDLLSRL
ncbi:SHOCT domain-containing protein [Ensifer soli]|uniref:SHOCT domain-containing protein n=1 Tax=Ciceribacter sp. sgz301302 TaxID=3342379 RepID=UPI0035B7660E